MTLCCWDWAHLDSRPVDREWVVKRKKQHRWASSSSWGLPCFSAWLAPLWRHLGTLSHSQVHTRGKVESMSDVNLVWEFTPTFELCSWYWGWRKMQESNKKIPNSKQMKLLYPCTYYNTVKCNICATCVKGHPELEHDLKSNMKLPTGQWNKEGATE